MHFYPAQYILSCWGFVSSSHRFSVSGEVRVSSPFFLPLFPIIFLYFKRRNVLSYLLSPLTPERAEDQKSAREESIKAPRAYK